MLFFDSYTAGPRTRMKSIEAAMKWLRTEKQPSDRVAVVNLAQRFELYQTFTNDDIKIYQGLQKVLESTPFAYYDRDDALQTLHSAFERCVRKGSRALQCMQPYVYTYENERMRERRDFMSSLTLMIRSMASIPYIKSVIIFSDGFSRAPAQDAIDVAASLVGFQNANLLNYNIRVDVDNDYREVSEAASRAKVSIHTIMPGGGRSTGFLSAAQRSPLDETKGARIDYFQRSAKNFEQGLTELALRTGGAISLNADPSAALDTVLDQSKGLYTIGLYASGSQAYRDYGVKIKSKRRGVKINSWNTISRTRIPLQIKGQMELRPGACTGGESRAMDVLVRVPRRDLTFTPVHGGSSANFSLFLTMYAEGSADPLFQEYRFFNIRSGETRFDESEAGPDPEIEERFLVPCRPLTVTAHITDAERGSIGKLVAATDK